VAVLGPSGSGKTTLLNVLGVLDHADSGDIIINGVSTKNYKSSDWDTYHNHRIGFVFQSYNLIPHQSVLQNVELALTLSGVKKAERRRRAKEALNQLKESCAVNVYYLNRDKAALITEMRQIWLDSPLVLEEPQVRVRLYPEEGTNQVVEFGFNWEESREELAARGNMTLAAAKRIMEEITPKEEGQTLTPEDLAAALRQRVTVDQETGGATSYDALVGGTANRRGVTMALKVLCDLAGLDTTVVEGRREGERAWWLIVKGDEYNYHLDPGGAEVMTGADEGLRALGYEWSAGRYPACEDIPVPEETGEGEQEEGETTEESPVEKND
jgi:ABC-type dipeptide/oligopeptide/nickel transport system ATPase subunit